MNRYQSPTPRTAMAFVAVALTALTVGAWVIAPTKLQPGLADARAQASMPASAVTEVTRIDAIEVVGVREPATVLVRHSQPAPKHKQQT
jgi:hypothetical protein